MAGGLHLHHIKCLESAATELANTRFMTACQAAKETSRSMLAAEMLAPHLHIMSSHMHAPFYKVIEMTS